MILFDFRCEDCWTIAEHLVDKETAEVECPLCEGKAERIISGTHWGTKYGQAACTTGDNQEPPPGAIDTRSLAEGESMASWKKKRRSQRRDERRKENGTYGRQKVFYGK